MGFHRALPASSTMHSQIVPSSHSATYDAENSAPSGCTLITLRLLIALTFRCWTVVGLVGPPKNLNDFGARSNQSYQSNLLEYKQI